MTVHRNGAQKVPAQKLPGLPERDRVQYQLLPGMLFTLIIIVATYPAAMDISITGPQPQGMDWDPPLVLCGEPIL